MDEKTREDAITLKIKLLQEKSRNIERRHKLAEEDKRIAESAGNAVNMRKQISSHPSKVQSYRSHAHMDDPHADVNDNDERMQQSRQKPRSRGQYDEEQFGHGYGDNYRQDADSHGYRQQERGGPRHDGRSLDNREPRQQRYHDRNKNRDDAYDGRRRDDRRPADRMGQDSRRVEYGGPRRQRDDRQYGQRHDDGRGRDPPQDQRALEREKQRRHNIETMEAQMSGKLQKGDKDWQQESGGFLNDPRREGEGEHTRHPPPRGVRYSPNDSKGRQQNRNYGVQERGDRTIEMTGRQRQDYDKWKQQRDEADKERLARSQAGGQWRRDWDSEKKSEDFEEDRRDRRRGGRFDRNDRRSERNEYSTGDRTDRRRHDDNPQERYENPNSRRDSDYNRRPPNRSNSGCDPQAKDDDRSHFRDQSDTKPRKSSSNEWGEDSEETWGSPQRTRSRDNDRPQKQRDGPSASAYPRKTSSKDEWDENDWGQEAEPPWDGKREHQSQNRPNRRPHGEREDQDSYNDRGPRRDNWGQRREDRDNQRDNYGRQQDEPERRKYGQNRDERGPRRENREQREDYHQPRDQRRNDWGQKRNDHAQSEENFGQRRQGRDQNPKDEWGQNEENWDQEESPKQRNDPRDNRSRHEENYDQQRKQGQRRDDRPRNEGDWNQRRNQSQRRDQEQGKDNWGQRRDQGQRRDDRGEKWGQQRDERDARRTIEERRRENPNQRRDNRDQTQRSYPNRENRNWETNQEPSENFNHNRSTERPSNTSNEPKDGAPVSNTKDDWGNNAEDDWGTDEVWGTEESPVLEVQQTQGDPKSLHDSRTEAVSEEPEKESSFADETVTQKMEPNTTDVKDEIASEDRDDSKIPLSEGVDDESPKNDRSEKHKNLKNRGNLKVRIDPKEKKTDSTQSSEVIAKRSTSLTSPLKTPENFVAVGDWALEVEMSSPNYDPSKQPPSLETAIKTDAPDSETQPVDPKEEEPDVKDEDKDDSKPKQDETESSQNQEPEIELETLDSAATKTDDDFETKNEPTAQTEPSDTQTFGFEDDFSDLTPKDIGLPAISDDISQAEQQGLITGEEKNVDKVAAPEDEDSDKEVYEDVQEEEPALAKSDDDDDNDSFATAGSEEKDAFAYEKLEEESTEDELGDMEVPSQEFLQADDVKDDKTQPPNIDNDFADATGPPTAFTPDENGTVQSIEGQSSNFQADKNEIDPSFSDFPEDSTATLNENLPENDFEPPESAEINKSQLPVDEKNTDQDESLQTASLDGANDSLIEDEVKEDSQQEELSENEPHKDDFDLENEDIQTSAAGKSLQEELESALSVEQSTVNEVLSDNLDYTAQESELTEVVKHCPEPVKTGLEPAETETSQTYPVINSVESEGVNSMKDEEKNAISSLQETTPEPDKGSEETEEESHPLSAEINEDDQSAC